MSDAVMRCPECHEGTVRLYPDGVAACDCCDFADHTEEVRE